MARKKQKNNMNNTENDFVAENAFDSAPSINIENVDELNNNIKNNFNENIENIISKDINTNEIEADFVTEFSNIKQTEQIEQSNISFIDIVRSLTSKYNNEKEIPNNKGFYDKKFQAKMQNMGWKRGEAWCSYYSELIWTEAYEQYNPALLEYIKKLFSGSTQATYNNFRNEGKEYGFKISNLPILGSVVIWQYTSNTSLGHAAILLDYDSSKNRLYTSEGNTTDNGSREGDTVATKIRTNTSKPVGSLKLRGFINPVI
jgi:hypothetical protein